MGRKIPGKKHRGIKDPYEQNTRRLESIKNKINRAPANPNDQPIPKSLIQLMSWQNKQKNKKKPAQKTPSLSKVQKRKAVDIKKPKNPVAQLKKIPGESNKSFNVRINEAVKFISTEKTFEDIHNDLGEDDDEKMGKKERFIPKRKRKNKDNEEPRLSKSQKKTLKTKMKKEKFKEEKELDKRCEVKRDFIAFGEIVHEPPTLHIKPRKAELADTVPRPARKDLLLNKLFASDQSTHTASKSFLPNIKIYPNKDSTSIDLKGKRKNLPFGVRSKLEETQKEAIEAYKLIKLSKVNKKQS